MSESEFVELFTLLIANANPTLSDEEVNRAVNEALELDNGPDADEPMA